MNFLFRCDAHPNAGLGHLARCLALAEALRHRSHSCRFAGRWSNDSRRMLREALFPFSESTTDLGTTEDVHACVSEAKGTYLIADGYEIGETWLKAIHEAGIPLGLIDDFGVLPSYRNCRAVINFTLGAAELSYAELPLQRLAAGPRFFCVRDELVALRARQQEKAFPPARILVTVGGSDRHGRTPLIYKTLKELSPRPRVHVLLSETDAARFPFETDSEELFHLPVRMAEHYAWADACICGGGLVKYECAFLNLPVAMFSQTPEQQSDSDLFCSRGLGWDLAPRGDSSRWESRLQEFLTARTISSSPDIFRQDSPARAAIHLETWMPIPVETPDSILP